MSARAKASRSSHRPVSDVGFCVDTRSLGRRPGSMRPLRRTVTEHGRLGLDLIAIAADAPVELDMRLEAVSEGVLVTGTVAAPTAGECVRCLEPFSGSVELHVTELFAYPASATEQTTDEDEIYRIEDDYLDLEPVIVDAAGLELPLRPMCSDDCRGLCPECGIRLAIADSGHTHEILDPRWAGLAALKLDGAVSAPHEAAAGSAGSGSATALTENEEK